VAWHDPAQRSLQPIASAGELDGFLDTVRLSTDPSSPLPKGIAARVVMGGEAIVTNDVMASAEIAFRDEALKHGFKAALHLPLKAAGEVAGVLILLSAETGVFDDEERGLLDELASDVSLALESMRKSEQLEYLAYYDALTGLPNRSLFHDRLDHSLRPRGGDGTLIAVALLDLERFRRVNETLGRVQGDALLSEIGGRLHALNDTAARLGADMFALILRGARNAAEVNRAVEAIVEQAFARPVRLGGEDLRVSCRSAVALFPGDGGDADALLRNAEAALRRSKRSDERIVFYAPEMNAQVADALTIENKLRRAVERREFVLHYQPKARLADATIVGAEALIRWQDPEKGLVPPGRFISVLEETGLIIEVGRWALQQAYADLNAWAQQGLRVQRVAVNVSSVQLQRKDFVDTVIEEIAGGGDHPEWLELEITESLLMRNVEESTRKLSILRGMGVTVAIDDFGTGYSSLSYLSRLPVDKLKIDRSFVSSVDSSGESTTLVTTMITLAHGLKMAVVAEGVETEDQARLLRLLRCDEAQGYHFGKPVPAAEFAGFLGR
jgi:diguanylate cyclase (GGDEF)-like protein